MSLLRDGAQLVVTPPGKTAAALSLLGVLLSAPVLLDYAKEFVAVDSCLDHGGSFDYSRMVCDMGAGHPRIPYVDRHPAAGAMVVAGVTSLAGAVVLLARARQPRRD